MESNKTKAERIVKNTLVLYIRMFLLMGVSLYTSRVILQALGVSDFGIYNVVGGFVAMFSIITKSLSGACSRFFNVAMGKGDKEKLKIIFSTSITIQLFLCVVVILLCEPIGIWYISNKMVLPPDRIVAAKWLLQFSLFSFCFKLITVPYNAAIIAHERMKAFAYVSILEGTGKLAISYLVMISPIDRLIFYGFSISLLHIIIRNISGHYCRKNFEECKCHLGIDRPTIKEMLGYSVWTLMGHSANILRIQGNTIVLNLFFGPAVNAAQALSNHLTNTVNGFVSNFMTVMRPQITQSYAKGKYDYMFKLIYKGARFSYYLLLLLSVPIIVNIDYILSIWLVEVPEHTATFATLSLFFVMTESISRPLIIANSAYGKIRDYQLIVGGILLLNVPISYILIARGGAPEVVKIVGLGLGIIALFVRVILLRKQIGLRTWDFTKKVILNVSIVSITSFSAPIIFNQNVPATTTSFIASLVISLLWSAFCILFIGCSKDERTYINSNVMRVIKNRMSKK